MMKLTDALKLSRKKFSTKKGRSLFASFTSALGILLILVMLMSTTGVLNFINNNFKDSLKEQPLMVDSRNFCSEDVQSEFPCQEKFSLESLRQEYPNFTFKSSESFSYISGTHFGISGKDDLNSDYKDRSPNSLMTSNEFFVQDFLYSDYKFQNIYEGKVPVILPKNYIADGEFENNNLSQEEEFNNTTKALEKYLGKTFTLTSINKGLISQQSEFGPQHTEYSEVKVIVVGFSSSVLAFDPLSYTMNNSIVIPQWAIETNEQLKSLMNNPTGEYSIVEFNSLEERDRFIEQYYQERMRGVLSRDNNINQTPVSSYSPIRSRFFIVEEFLKVATIGGLAVGGFLLVISSLFTLTTIGKLVDDSKKEIGVFRAFGALKSDIRKIYYGYALILINMGLLIGFVLAIIINIILSLAFGSRLFYSLINLGNNFAADRPELLFVSFPILPMITLFIVINLLGILSAIVPIRRATKIDPIIVMRDE